MTARGGATWGGQARGVVCYSYPRVGPELVNISLGEIGVGGRGRKGEAAAATVSSPVSGLQCLPDAEYGTVTAHNIDWLTLPTQPWIG